MAGNALDRPAVKTQIENAEQAVENVCAKIAIMGERLEFLSEGYAGANADSTISKVYTDYENLLNWCMGAFGGKDGNDQLHRYHYAIKQLANDGADGDEISPNLGYYGSLNFTHCVKSTSTPGIKDFEATKSDVNDLKAATNDFVAATDDIISAYQAIWWTADSAGNDKMKEEAHRAADQVRHMVEYYKGKFEEINEKFAQCVETHSRQQGLAADEAAEKEQELLNMLNSVNFETISADQNAAELIASNWRNT